jgi:hypothetical protein
MAFLIRARQMSCSPDEALDKFLLILFKICRLEGEMKQVLWPVVILSAAFSAACANDGANPLGPSTAGGSIGNGTRAVATSSGVAGEKVSLCHATGNETYVPINISVAAQAVHRAHGDAAVGQSVPGQPGHIFDTNWYIDPFRYHVRGGRSAQYQPSPIRARGFRLCVPTYLRPTDADVFS